jgi:hypothetical protein
MTLQPPQPIKPVAKVKSRNEMSYCTEDELMLKFLYLCWENDKRHEKKGPIGAVGRAKE